MNVLDALCTPLGTGRSFLRSPLFVFLEFKA
jgi:hypothetical protein